jgi:alanine dehydrogenase
MQIGVPKEIKTNENRVALAPAGAEALVSAGHTVHVEGGRWGGKRLLRRGLHRVGAHIAPDADAVWSAADMILKVKEPIEPGVGAHPGGGRRCFTYFHFAADERLTRAHIDSGATCIAYETGRAADARAAAAHADVGGRRTDGRAGGRRSTSRSSTAAAACC